MITFSHFMELTKAVSLFEDDKVRTEPHTFIENSRFITNPRIEEFD